MSNKELGIYVGLIVAGLIVARRAAGSAAAAIDPTSTENVFYEGANNVFDILDDGVDDGSFNLGRWIYETTHPGSVPYDDVPFDGSRGTVYDPAYDG